MAIFTLKNNHKKTDMKTIKIVSAIMMMCSFAFAKPHPKNSDITRAAYKDQLKESKAQDKANARIKLKDSKDHERSEAVKEARIAKKKAKSNQMRYRHEAKDRKNFHDRRVSCKA